MGQEEEAAAAAEDVFFVAPEEEKMLIRYGVETVVAMLAAGLTIQWGERRSKPRQQPDWQGCREVEGWVVEGEEGEEGEEEGVEEVGEERELLGAALVVVEVPVVV